MRTLMRGLAVVCGVAALCWVARRMLRSAAPRSERADVTDEALIEAGPFEVYRAVVDEHDGRTNWWAPHLSMQLRSGDCYDRVGAIVDNTVRVHGRLPITFTTRTTEVEEGASIRVEYVAGAFRGDAVWGFRDVDGKTLASMRWRRPTRTP